MNCSYPDCPYPARSACDNCDSRFCEEHGTVGGDHYVEDFGPVAYPSICWKCGGFNVDE